MDPLPLRKKNPCYGPLKMPFSASSSCQAGQVGGFHAADGTENCWARGVTSWPRCMWSSWWLSGSDVALAGEENIPWEGWMKQPKWWEEGGGWNIVALSQMRMGGECKCVSRLPVSLSAGYWGAAQITALHGPFSVRDISLRVSLLFIGLA